MTETHRWLDARRRELGSREAGAGVLLTTGLVLVALALGLLLARAGLYRVLPVTVLAAWGAVIAAAWLGLRWYARAARGSGTQAVADEVEEQGGLRRGSVSGISSGAPRTGSASLGALADARVAEWLRGYGTQALGAARARRTRALGRGFAAASAGALIFLLARPGAPAGAEFWRPLAVVARSQGPVELDVDRVQVRRGEQVRVRVSAAGRRAAVLWLRAPGEPWSGVPLALDSGGRAEHLLGPLDSDRYLRASSGTRSSDTVHVRVALPAFLADLQLIARYPAYLDRADEPLMPGPEALPLPVGTVVETQGQATVPVASAAWRSERGSLDLAARGARFSGRMVVRASGRWQLHVTPERGVPWDDRPPELNLIAVPDSAPVVAVPVPGGDTTAPLTLRQPLVIDTRDDHLVTRVELVSRRVSRLGVAGAPRTEPVPLPEGGAERAVLQWMLDLNGQGYLPGDTAYFRVRAYDNAPTPQMGETREFVLRLPSAAELREAMRSQSRALAAAADSLARAQRDLTRATEQLANERERPTDAQRPGAGRSPAGELPFRSAERAGEMADQQAQVAARAEQLRQELRELADAAWNAGLTDPAWQEQLRELEALLRQAVTPELEERLRALREALEKLDAEAVREALRRLAETGRQLRDELARSRELFERAAVEGSMSTLATDAEELAQRQQEWNESQGRQPDSSLARSEEQLAAEADSLRARLNELQQAMEQMGANPDGTRQAGEGAQQAAQEMRQAAAQTRAGQAQRARQSGEAAEQALDPLAEQLRQERDALRDEWRQEVIATLDHALAETAELAQRQMDVAERMQRGDAGGDVRGEQAAIREGVDRILQRLQGAAGKNALVSPRVGTSLGFARLRMTEALDQLQRASPSPGDAGELAGQAVDALNAMAHALLGSRGDVAGAQSGSGLEEAIAKLAELAAQQNALNGQAGGMLPLVPMGGEGLLSDLRAMAEKQRRLAEELDKLNAQGDIGAADQLAEQARELARELEAGRLDRRTIERQERLFRRLLDAGRTLRGEEEDEEKERQSETARPGNVRLPAALQSGSRRGPRFAYPTWEELQRLSPEERRLILDYFRRLNDGRP